MRLHNILESAKFVFIVPIAVFVLLAYIGSFAQKGARIDLPEERAELPSCTKSADASPKEVLQLTNMIRLITGNQLPEVKTVRFAGLIFHASRKYEVNPLEIIAIIMVESHFKENSINNETGDYGLGQINWEYWGKDLGLTPRNFWILQSTSS
jgi:hypothetical protein